MNRAYYDSWCKGGGAGESIVRVRVAPADRLGALSAVFGRLAVEFEMLVYGWMDRLCADYGGGYWEFYRLSNGGFYMAPAGKGGYRIFCEGNGFDGVLGADSAGVVVSLFAYNVLAARYQREQEIEGIMRCGILRLGLRRWG